MRAGRAVETLPEIGTGVVTGGTFLLLIKAASEIQFLSMGRECRISRRRRSGMRRQSFRV